MFLSFQCTHVLVFPVYPCSCLSSVPMFLSFQCTHVLVFLVYPCSCLSSVPMFLSFQCTHVLVFLVCPCSCLSSVPMFLSFQCTHVLVFLVYPCSCLSSDAFPLLDLDALTICIRPKLQICSTALLQETAAEVDPDSVNRVFQETFLQMVTDLLYWSNHFLSSYVHRMCDDG